MKREAIVPTGMAVTLVVAIAYLLSAPQVGNLQLIASTLLLCLYVGATILRPVLGIALVCATAPFLGMLRRILYQQSQTSFDALLLVIPLYSALMLLVIVTTHRDRFHTILRQSLTSRLLLALMLILLLQVFNPLQGGLNVGLAGVLFYIVPLCWYFIGRLYLTEGTMKGILSIFIVASVIAAGYGLMQTLVGFPDFDAYWISQVSKGGYAALYVGRTIRALGPATSAAEYAGFLSAGLACLLALTVFRWQLLALVPAALLATALFLESSRGAAISIAVVLVAFIALRQRSKPVAIVVIGLLCLIGVFAYQQLSQTVYTTSTASSSQLGGLLAHQINGLAHPFDQRYSTGQSHFQQIINAFGASIRNPLGFGLGATTLAATKFGASAMSAELDIPNVFLSGSLIAGLLYVVILFRTFRAGASLVFRHKHIVDVLAFATVAVTFGQILNGGLYSLMPFVWMFIAWIDYRATDEAKITVSPATRHQAPPIPSIKLIKGKTPQCA